MSSTAGQVIRCKGIQDHMADRKLGNLYLHILLSLFI
ncbi:hypothetical protein CK203_086360 [Vitis vinifera]|uniref:Uncharacterized protein n=1 Tax=Vitis vinifera TaxID=29760 RepID=A0A438DB90_VITVI|nr:hypothetical protein CK203_086360 [Vitis vinifera]